MNYKVQHITNKKKIIRDMKPESLTIHSTGNPNSTAQNERDNLNRTNNTTSTGFHIAVDDKEAIECIPFNKVAYHAGDGGKGPGNSTSIGLEVCESGNRTRSLENAIKVSADILYKYNLDIDKLKRHYDWSGKNCPRILSANGWMEWILFKEKVLAHLNSLKHIEVTTEKKSLYRVQVGAYTIKNNAEKLLIDLADKGFKGFIKEESMEVEIILEVPRKKLVSYNSIRGSTIIEVDPQDLYIDVAKEIGTNIKGDFVNGSFYDMASMRSISTLVSNGKVLAGQLPHDNVKRGTMVVWKDKTVTVEMIDFISKFPKLKDIKFAIGGFNLLNGDIRKQLKSEWFNYNTVGYKTWRTMLGYSKKVNKMLIVIVPNTDAEEGQALMKQIGCDIAIGLDSGGSTSGRFNGKAIRLTSRKLHNIIRW